MTGNDRAAVIGYLVLAGEELKKSAKQAREGGTMGAVRAHLRGAVELLDEARAYVGWQEAFDARFEDEPDPEPAEAAEDPWDGASDEDPAAPVLALPEPVATGDA